MFGPLRAIESQDLDRVSEFLVRIHQRNASAPFADRRVLHWKYLWPRSNWVGSRGFVLERDGKILAHAGVVPTVFRLSTGETVRSATVIDWAAARSAPGAGVTLMVQVADRVGAVFVIGGAPPARRIEPKIGFRNAGVARAYVRWVRPWREFRIRPKTPRSALRLLHGMARSLGPKPTCEPEWDSVLINEFDESLETLLNGKPVSLTLCQRTVEDLNYMLQCPAMEMKGFLLRRRESVVGYFIVAKAGWEARIVDIFVNSDKPRDWRLAYGTAAHAVGRCPEICRIRARATVPLFVEALIQNGFWLQHEDPIMIRDPRSLLASAFPINLQMFEDDAAYLTT